jgi:hypothetical protein
MAPLPGLGIECVYLFLPAVPYVVAQTLQRGRVQGQASRIQADAHGW